MAASSFGATNIRIELELTTASSPTWSGQSYVTVRHIPGSDTDVVQVMGRGSQSVSLRLLLDPTEYTALSGQVQTEAELNMAGISQGTCLLEQLDGPERHIDGWVTVSASFRKVT